ncbi:uncharacterized protein [Setaria viridis]|uniref:uncharacterized protein n=1 Tax=Setaria viridis TaxID=4556 RepID=UPI003B3B5059
MPTSGRDRGTVAVNRLTPCTGSVRSGGSAPLGEPVGLVAKQALKRPGASWFVRLVSVSPALCLYSLLSAAVRYFVFANAIGSVYMGLLYRAASSVCQYHCHGRLRPIQRRRSAPSPPPPRPLPPQLLVRPRDRTLVVGVIRRRPTILSTSCGYGRAPLVPASDHWGNWTFLLSTAALGLWSEKRAPAGKKALAGALVSVLLGLAASSAGVVAADAPAYRAALDYLLPLAVPLLLFRADLRRALRSTGAPLRAFLLGSAATAMGTAVAFRIVPMRSLGPDSWKIAVALMSRHIGGAFSYVAVCEGLGVSPSTMEAGLAAANTIRALYFTGLFALAAKIPAEDSRSMGEGSEPPLTADDEMLPAAQSAIAVAAAFAICRAAKLATSRLGQFGIEGASLPCAAATVVLALATFFPSQIRKLAPSDDALAAIMMQLWELTEASAMPSAQRPAYSRSRSRSCRSRCISW